MEKLQTVLTALTPVQPSTKSEAKAYDASIRQHIALLSSSTAEIHPLVLDNSQKILENLDPSVHSISYLFVLQILSESIGSGLEISSKLPLDKIVAFLYSFDPIQIRYVGQSLLSLLEKIGSGQLFSATVAVELLCAVILRIDPTGSLFTSTHFMLARLAYDFDSVEAALQVIDRDILFYPNSSNSKANGILCDAALLPTSYISPQTGLTDKITTAMVLEYNYLRGLMYISRRDWGKAEEALEQVMSHPTKEKGVSKIMVDSYKRWVLVGLLGQGKASAPLPYTSGTSQGSYKVIAKAYDNVAEIFNSGQAEKLKSQIEENAPIWEEDGTSSLLQEILSSYQKWQIIGLRHIYERVGIAEIRQATLNAVTGKTLEDDDAVLILIRQMIEAGMLTGQLEKDESGSYLSFRQDGGAVSEEEFATQIARSYRNIEAISEQYKQMNKQLSSSKEYVKFIVREQKRGEKDGTDAGVVFDSQIEDEDLMADVVAHS